MMKRAAYIMLVICCALFWSGCGTRVKLSEPAKESLRSTGEIPRTPEKKVIEAHRTQDEMRSQMAALFPEDGVISGWQKADETALFDEETLFQHINGAAEAFFAYDFQLCGTAEYIPRSDSDKDAVSSEDDFIVLDIYDMGWAINAFGMYASELYSESETVDIGTQGYVESSALNFWKGPYYVKIIGSTTEENVTKANMELAKYIAQKIPAKPEKPPMLSLLPDEGLVPGTEKFILSNILGYSFLKNGVTAMYQMEGEENPLFIMECESIDDAKNQLAQFAGYEEKSAEDMAKITDLGEEGFTAKDKYYKRIIASRQGRYLILAISVTNEAAARELIRKAIENTERSDR